MVRHFAIFLLALSLPQLAACKPGDAAPAPKPAMLEIHLKHIRARPMLLFLAEFSGRNFAAGGEFRNARLNVYKDRIDASQLMDELIKEQGLAVKQRGGIDMVASTCRLARSPDIQPLVEARQGKTAKDIDATPWTFDFIAVSSESLFGDVLSDIWQARFDLSGIEAKEPITMRANEKSMMDMTAAILTVQGLSLQPAGKGSFRLVPDAQLKDCPSATAGKPYQTVKDVDYLAPDPKYIEHDCDWKTKRYCSNLEHYNLQDLRAAGYIRTAAGNTYAVFETPAKWFEKLEVGKRIGLNGKLSTIGKDSVTIEEEITDPGGRTQIKKTTLKYR